MITNTPMRRKKNIWTREWNSVNNVLVSCITLKVFRLYGLFGFLGVELTLFVVELMDVLNWCFLCWTHGFWGEKEWPYCDELSGCGTEADPSWINLFDPVLNHFWQQGLAHWTRGRSHKNRQSLVYIWFSPKMSYLLISGL